MLRRLLVGAEVLDEAVRARHLRALQDRAELADVGAIAEDRVQVGANEGVAAEVRGAADAVLRAEVEEGLLEGPSARVEQLGLQRLDALRRRHHLCPRVAGLLLGGFVVLLARAVRGGGLVARLESPAAGRALLGLGIRLEQRGELDVDALRLLLLLLGVDGELDLGVGKGDQLQNEVALLGRRVLRPAEVVQ